MLCEDLHPSWIEEMVKLADQNKLSSSQTKRKKRIYGELGGSQEIYSE